MSLEIKVARIFRLNNNEGVVKAYADISVNDALLIKGLKIIDGKHGLFVSMPCEKGQDEKWYEVVRPLEKEVKALISEVVLTAYNEEASNESN